MYKQRENNVWRKGLLLFRVVYTKVGTVYNVYYVYNVRSSDVLYIVFFQIKIAYKLW